MASNKLKKSAQLYDLQLKEELAMTSKELLKIAQRFGINPQGQSKPELIRSIQRQEGNFDCFASVTSGECDQSMCLWRSDCLELPKPATS